MRSEAHDEWAALAQLLAQLLAAHTSTILDARARDAASMALSTLAAAVSSPIGTTETRYPLYHLHAMYQSSASWQNFTVQKRPAAVAQVARALLCFPAVRCSSCRSCCRQRGMPPSSVCSCRCCCRAWPS